MLVSLTIGAVGIARTPLWRDEAATWSFSQLSWSALARTVGHVDGVFAPYYAFIKLWTTASDATAWLRLPSLIAAVLTVGVAAAIGNRLGGRSAGGLAGMLLATNPTFAAYSVETRPYAIAAFASTAATWALVRALTEPSKRMWLWYAGLGALSVSAHLMSLLVFLGHIAAVTALALARPESRTRARGFLLPVAAVLVSAIPFLWLASRQQQQLAWVRTRSLSALPSAYHFMAGGQLLRAVAAVGVTMLLVGVVRSGFGGDAAILLGVSSIIAPIPLIVIAATGRRIYVPRYLLPATPLLAITTAAGLVYGASLLRNIKMRVLVAGVATLAIAFVGASISLHAALDDERWTDPTERIAKMVANDVHVGDVIIETPALSALGVGRVWHDERSESGVMQSLANSTRTDWRRVVAVGGGRLRTEAHDTSPARRTWLIGVPNGVGPWSSAAESLRSADCIREPTSLQDLPGLRLSAWRYSCPGP